MSTKLIVIVVFSPVFLLPALFVAVVGARTADYYLKAQLSVKREMRSTSVPLILRVY